MTKSNADSDALATIMSKHRRSRLLPFALVVLAMATSCGDHQETLDSARKENLHVVRALLTVDGEAALDKYFPKSIVQVCLISFTQDPLEVKKLATSKDARTGRVLIPVGDEAINILVEFSDSTSAQLIFRLSELTLSAGATLHPPCRKGGVLYLKRMPGFSELISFGSMQ